MITKQKAIEILVDEPCPMTPREAADALDRAGAFPDEATLAEIDHVAREIARPGSYSLATPSEWRSWALRLATACRKAGLVRP